jgi:fructose-1,6-bisphosphatase/inositol monophosphatase family enzyme
MDGDLDRERRSDRRTPVTGRRLAGSFQEELRFAREVALDMGRIIRAAFGQPNAVAFKADGSPVTEVDLRVNDEVIARISRRYRADAVRAEERDHGDADSSRQWVCDPLDGTNAFVLGVPTSVFMLAFAVDGVLELAVVRDPFSGREYIASAGAGAFCDDAAIQVSGDGLGDGCVALGSDSFMFAPALQLSGTRLAAVPGSGYKAMMVARGAAVATIRSSADIHDVAPAALIVREAGGRVSALDGSPILLDRAPDGVIVSNRQAHSALVDIALSVREQQCCCAPSPLR